ncbi:hypothetical protein FISHEDRAFT_33327 [Fistulina hepatica ATCC 64428]|uniref:Protein argonaute N-terminal domain-containing protein n=1 Tax=Fistulina hepatica ATCC 64428 TaxID=1128425 RepID=A0A0D7APF8_9AGAR|nr:hypothetical protein FISHEDRAFT_33327 [Fistulina hepatica ATCC 64428]
MSGRPQRGRGRGGGRGGGDRGGSSNRGRGRGRGAPADIQVGLHAGNTQVTTVGVKRPGYGAAGTPRRIQANTFPVELPTGWVYHYDAVNADEKKLPVRFNRQLIERLQDDNPQTFSNRGVYDGRKNLFTSQELIDNGSPLMTRTVQLMISLPS